MRHVRIAVTALVVLLCTAGAAEARRRAVRSPEPFDETNLTTEEWLRAHAIAFASDQPRTGFNDLRALSAIVGTSRIVSLGEATHGTHEFFTMKHRVLEYLVENMGFTVFAMEAALAECDVINDYVLDGEGEPSAALAGQHFWTWNTDEVLDLIVWMREYNLRRGNRPAISFRGFDMQYSDLAIAKATAYLERIDPSGAADIASRWNCFVPYAGNAANYLSRPDAEKQSCRADLEAAYATFEARRNDYAARSSAAEYERMLRYARVIVQHEALSARSVFSRAALRDTFMAENATWLANTANPGEKLVLWAHNYHVSAVAGAMGAALRAHFPDEQMVVFGFAFDHGAFNALSAADRSLRSFAVAPVDQGFDPLFRSTGAARWIVDLRRIGSIAAREYFSQPRTMWSIGSVFDDTIPATIYRVSSQLPGHYDAIIWFAETTPATPRSF